MTDQEQQVRDEQRRRWNELAAQLGLDPEPEPGQQAKPGAPAARAEVTPKPPAVAAPGLTKEELPERAEERPRPPEVEQRSEEPHRRRGRGRHEEQRPERRQGAHRHREEQAEKSVEERPQTEAAERFAEKPLAAETDVEPDDAEKLGTAPGEPEEEPRRRRRRRGRRSGQGRKEQEREPAAADVGEEPALEAETEPEAAEDVEREPRGRRRRVDAKVETEDDDDVDDKTEEADTQEDDTPDEMDDLSDWNVPSWQDLIASLYRPER
jgi:hypothetical protein